MNTLTFCAACLATFRLTRLITDDKITDWFRLWVVRSAPRAAKKKTREGISCPFCVSFYFACFVTVGLALMPVIRWQDAWFWAFAIWGGSILLNEIFMYLMTKSK